MAGFRIFHIYNGACSVETLLQVLTFALFPGSGCVVQSSVELLDSVNELELPLSHMIRMINNQHSSIANLLFGR
jgi:hypothetical protein